MIAASLRHVQSGPMQRSYRFIIYIPIHNILVGSSRHHGVNKIFHLSLDLFHPSVAEVLELASAEEQLQRFAMVLLMMLSLSLRCLVSVLLSVLPLICQLPVQHVHDWQEPGCRRLRLGGLLTCGCPT